jgi:hypothetical protein
MAAVITMVCVRDKGSSIVSWSGFLTTVQMFRGSIPGATRFSRSTVSGTEPTQPQEDN